MLDAKEDGFQVKEMALFESNYDDEYDDTYDDADAQIVDPSVSADDEVATHQVVNAGPSRGKDVQEEEVCLSLGHLRWTSNQKIFFLNLCLCRVCTRRPFLRRLPGREPVTRACLSEITR